MSATDPLQGKAGFNGNGNAPEEYRLPLRADGQVDFDALNRDSEALDDDLRRFEAFGEYERRQIDEEYWHLKRREHVEAHRGGGVVGKDRYAGRHVDLGPLLAKPAKPVPWRVWDLVADGTVTILAGESGCGKSWLAQALCTGVARGLPIAGLPCTRGRALYIDAEMGPQMFVDQRLRSAGISAPEFEYINAMGLDVSKDADLAWLEGKVRETEANLVVVDSLRRLTPSKSENDSDDMAPTVAAVAKLARDTESAILLVHHKGDSDKFYRGSTAIKDQADALFALLREGDEEGADNGIRRLRCRGGRGKMRYAPEPADIYLEISPLDGGVVACGEPASETGRPQPARQLVKKAILDALPARTKTEAAVVVGRGRDDYTFKAAWVELERAGVITQTGSPKLWRAVTDPRETRPPATNSEELATAEQEALFKRLAEGHGEDEGAS